MTWFFEFNRWLIISSLRYDFFQFHFFGTVCNFFETVFEQWLIFGDLPFWYYF